jgi:4-carboxymuconolactone decarboxylase
MARLTLPPEDVLTAAQRAVCEEVVAGKRGKVPSPMIAWVRNPDIARRAQQLGEVLRFQTSLDQRLVELAILVCARHWTAHQVWTSHVRYARQFGVDEAAITAIAAGTTPVFASEYEGLVFEVSSSLLEKRRIADALYRRAVATLGEPGVVELVAVIGYYCLVGLTANAFELGLPQNMAAELRDPDLPGAAD